MTEAVRAALVSVAQYVRLFVRYTIGWGLLAVAGVIVIGLWQGLTGSGGAARDAAAVLLLPVFVLYAIIPSFVWWALLGGFVIWIALAVLREVVRSAVYDALRDREHR
jgi:hypothetical protein